MKGIREGQRFEAAEYLDRQIVAMKAGCLSVGRAKGRERTGGWYAITTEQLGSSRASLHTAVVKLFDQSELAFPV